MEELQRMLEQFVSPVNVQTIAPVMQTMEVPFAVMQHRLDAYVWGAIAKDAANPAAQQVAIAMLAAVQGGQVPPQALAGAGQVAAGAPAMLPAQAVPAGVVPAGMVPQGVVPPGVIPQGAVPTGVPAVSPATQPVAPAAGQTVAATPAGASPDANEVVRLVNEARAAKGLKPLSLDPKLVQAAAAHSQQMATTGKMAHDGIGDGNPHDRIRKVEPTAKLTAENVAYGQPDAATVVKGWLDSPPHRRNILDPKLTKIGVEVVRTPDGTPYWTQVFAG